MALDGSFNQNIATNAIVTGNYLPLIVISHGALGTWQAHADLAVTLANAGFVVAALTHDEYGLNFLLLTPADRSVQLRTLTDYALHDWRGHSQLNGRVGAFGFSLGGFTVLVAAGGKPNIASMTPHCVVFPAEWSCLMQANHHLDLAYSPSPLSAWVAEPRIKAAVIVAPAMGYLFGHAGLASVRIPIQLWQGGNDQTLQFPWNAEVVRQSLPYPPDYHLVVGADHDDFARWCSHGAKVGTADACLSPTGFDRYASYQDFKKSVVTFFKRALGVSK